MSYNVEWKQGAIEDVTALFDYIAENSSLWDAQNVTDRVLAAADKLAEFPRLYEVDSRYGEDVRRISLMGQHLTGKIFTQRIERNNLTLRTRIKRLARKTICFSRSVELHEKVIGAFIEKYMFY